MKAFINTPITKDQFVKQIRWHQEQDAIIKGSYIEMEKGKFKGCAVGCSINSIAIELGKKDLDHASHELYDEYLGVPKWLARVEDTIFEGLPEDRYKSWPLEFAEAINPGADLDKIKPKFLIMVLESCLEYVQKDEFKQQKDALLDVIHLWENKDNYSKEDFKEAADATRAAAEAAWDAAEAAAEAAWDAAEAAAEAAWDAAEAAAGAAEAAARAARAAARAARDAKYNYFADELLNLMKHCK